MQIHLEYLGKKIRKNKPSVLSYWSLTFPLYRCACISTRKENITGQDDLKITTSTELSFLKKKGICK